MDEKQALEFLGSNCEPCPKCKYYNNLYCHRNWETRGITPCDITGTAIDVLKSFIEEKTKSWIPCSERKPKHKQLVIIKMGNNKSSFNNTRTAQYNSTDKVFIYNISKKSSGCIKEEFVTEWFPFPEVDNDKN